jgi:hypothetical protein
MSPEEARDILGTPAAQKETERLNQLKSKVEAAIRNPNADEFKLTIEGQEEADAADKRHTVSSSFFDEDAISTSFKAWVAKCNGLSVDEAINAARIRSEFTTDEMQYLMDTSVHARIRNGFKKRLLAMASEAE